jgi:hypothetical protein
VEQAGVLPSRRLHDKCNLPGFTKDHRTVHLQYVDNFASLRTDRTEVMSAKEAVQELMRSRGFSMHEEGDGLSKTELLGWLLDGCRGMVAPTQRRIWRLRAALDAAICRGRLSGKQLERLVGHCTFTALIRRESLSCFQAVCDFVRIYGPCEAPLPVGVKRELTICRGILPLIRHRMRSPWCEEFLTCDATRACPPAPPSRKTIYGALAAILLTWHKV